MFARTAFGYFGYLYNCIRMFDYSHPSKDLEVFSERQSSMLETSSVVGVTARRTLKGICNDMDFFSKPERSVRLKKIDGYLRRKKKILGT